jgi:hypothetical protein
MAFYLSDVTHGRLKDREDADPELIDKGIVLTHEFVGKMRCIEAGIGQPPDMQVWSGDIDGEITVRRGLAGKPIATIPKRPECFVYAMARYGNHMWVGYSDGWMVIFDARTRKVVQEMKAHVGAVNCMIVINDYVFSGGNDWQIVQWDPITMAKRSAPYGQLSGHQNAVRCFATDGTYLYSGGDDYSIRCWELESTYERASPWPIVMHGDSVRAICVNEVYLFSSSMDGTVKVWNTQTAQLIRELDHESNAVNTLALDPSSGRIWAGTTGGLIRIWDANTLSPVAELHEHHTTHVPLVRIMARINAIKAWTVGADKKIRIWYSDNEANEIEFAELQHMEYSLQQLVESCRIQIISNYQELERCKIEVKELEESDHRRKEAIAVVLGNRQQVRQKRRFLATAELWLIKQKYLAQQKTLADNFQRRTDSALMLRYYVQLQQFAKSRQAKRSLENIGRTLRSRHEANVTRTYLWNLQESLRRKQQAAKALQVANYAAQHIDAAHRRRAFDAWSRFIQIKKSGNQRVALSQVLLKESNNAMLRIFWYKLQRFITIERQVQARNEHTNTMCVFHLKFLMRQYYDRLRANAQAKRLAKQREITVSSVLSTYNRHVLQAYYQRWATCIRQSRATASVESVRLQKEQIADMESTLKNSATTTEEELEAQLKIKQRELADILAENDELDDELAELLERKKQLTRDLMKDQSIDSSKPKEEQIIEAMHFLTARGVSCFHDREEMAAAREAAKTTSAEVVYEEGITVVRKLCAKLVKPAKLMEKGEADWYTGEMWGKVTNKTVPKAVKGITRMVTAFDMLNVGKIDSWLATDENGKRVWNAKHKHCEEVLCNFGTLLEFAVRQYRIRRNEDPLTGEPLQALPAKKKSFRTGGGEKLKRLNSKGKSGAGKKKAAAGGAKKAAPATAKKPAAGKATPAVKKSAGGAAAKKKTADPAAKKKPAASGDKKGAKKAPAKKGAVKKVGKGKAKKTAAEDGEPKPAPAEPQPEQESSSSAPVEAAPQPAEAAPAESRNAEANADGGAATHSPAVEAVPESNDPQSSKEPVSNEAVAEPEAVQPAATESASTAEPDAENAAPAETPAAAPAEGETTEASSPSKPE